MLNRRILFIHLSKNDFHGIFCSWHLEPLDGFRMFQPIELCDFFRRTSHNNLWHISSCLILLTVEHVHLKGAMWLYTFFFSLKSFADFGCQGSTDIGWISNTIPIREYIKVIYRKKEIEEKNWKFNRSGTFVMPTKMKFVCKNYIRIVYFWNDTETLNSISIVLISQFVNEIRFFFHTHFIFIWFHAPSKNVRSISNFDFPLFEFQAQEKKWVQKKKCINFKLFRIKFIYWNVNGIVYIFNDMVWLIEFHIADFGGSSMLILSDSILWSGLAVMMPKKRRNSNTQNVDYFHSLSE